MTGAENRCRFGSRHRPQMKKSIPSLLAALALVIALPLALFGGWTSDVSCYKPNPSYDGEAGVTYQDGTNEVFGEVWLEHFFYSGPNYAMHHRYGRPGTESTWDSNHNQNWYYVAAGFGWTHCTHFYKAETQCWLIDADAEVKSNS